MTRKQPGNGVTTSEPNDAKERASISNHRSLSSDWTGSWLGWLALNPYSSSHQHLHLLPTNNQVASLTAVAVD